MKNKTVRLALAGVFGLAAYLFIMQRPWAMQVGAKAVGRPVYCPWGRLLAVPWSSERFVSRFAEHRRQVSVLSTDDSRGIELVRSVAGDFWIKTSGDLMDGKTLLAYVLAEGDWMFAETPGEEIRPGSVVVDVGAHVGTFTSRALKAGAAKVVAIEPDPVNVECLKRNFREQLTDGRVTIMPEGAWSKEDTLDFHVGKENSGTGSLLGSAGQQTIKIPVRRIDAMLADLGVTRVDFIKMDIEGAERDALSGARDTLRKYRPRLMIENYHRDDDSVALPAIIRTANPGYQPTCGPCSMDPNHDAKFVPHTIFYN